VKTRFPESFTATANGEPSGVLATAPLRLSELPGARTPPKACWFARKVLERCEKMWSTRSSPTQPRVWHTPAASSKSKPVSRKEVGEESSAGAAAGLGTAVAGAAPDLGAALAGGATAVERMAGAAGTARARDRGV